MECNLAHIETVTSATIQASLVRHNCQSILRSKALTSSKNAILWPGRKQQITLRIDPDVLTFFRRQGKGYQSTINAVLRKYVEERKRRAG